MFITSALANTTASAPSVGGDSLSWLIQIGLIFLIFFVLVILPAQRRAKEQNQMLSSIQKGDRVVFGGMVGTVKKVVDEEVLMVEIAEGVEVKVFRSFVLQVLSDSSVENNKK